MLQAALNLLGHLRASLVINENVDLGLERLIALRQLADGVIAPHQAALIGKVDLGIRRVVETIRTQMEMRSQGLKAGCFKRFRFLTRCVFILTEPEPFETTDEFTFDGHISVFIYFGQKGLLLFQPAQQNGCAPINKSLCQRFVQSIRQAVFYYAGFIPPMNFVIDPTLTLRDICPRANKSQSFRQRIDVACGLVDAFDLTRQPIVRDMSALMQIAKNRPQKACVFPMADATKIRDAAHIPEQFDRGSVTGTRQHFGLLRQRFQRPEIIRLAGFDKDVVAGGLFKRFDQPADRAKLKRVVAPLQFAQWGKTMIHDRLRDLIGQIAGLASDAKSAVAHAPARATGNLGQLVWRKLAHTAPIKLAERRKRHVVNIKVQPHADGICGHQKINITVLIKLDLRVAGAWAQRPHHNRRAALLSPQQFSDGINIVDRKPNNSRPRLHPADLFGTGIGQLGHPFAADKFNSGHQCCNRAAHCIGPKEQGLMRPTSAQKPVGKDMPPLGIGA